MEAPKNEGDHLVEDRMSEHDVGVCLIHVASGRRDSEEVFQFAENHGKKVERAIKAVVYKRFHGDVFVRDFTYRKKSVEFLVFLGAVGSFLTEYKDIRESLDQLSDDLATAVESVYISQDCPHGEVTSYWQPGPAFPKPAPHAGANVTGSGRKLAIAGSILAGIAILIALVNFGHGEREEKTSEKIQIVTPAKQAEEKESTLVARCGHCKGNGVCDSAEGEKTCFNCTKALAVNDAVKGAICSVCEGRGYHIPALVIERDRFLHRLTTIACVSAVGIVVLLAFVLVTPFQRGLRGLRKSLFS